MNRPKQSHLQDQILLFLNSADQPIQSLAELAHNLDAHRSSVSRSMHALKDLGLVMKNDQGGWLITKAGHVEVAILQEKTARKAMAAFAELGKLDNFANVSAAPISEFAREIQAQQTRIAEVMTRGMDTQLQRILDNFPKEEFLKFGKDAQERSAEMMKVFNFLSKSDFNIGLPSKSIKQVVAQQAAMENAFRKFGVSDSFQEAMTSALTNTQQITALVEAMKPGLDALDRLKSSYLENFGDALASPSISEMMAQINMTDKVCSRLIQEAASFATAHQYLNSWALELPTINTQLAQQLTATGMAINRTIGAVTTLRLAQYSESHLWRLCPHVTEVTRTHLGLFADGISKLEDSGQLGSLDSTSKITADYVSTVASIAAPSPSKKIDQGYYFDLDDRVVAVLGELGPQFRKMWNGAWETANSDNPDGLRQAAHSGRELFMQSLAYLAPNQAFSPEEIERYGDDGKVTHRMRVEKILGNNSTARKWAGAVADAVIGSLNTLTGISHYRSADPPIGRSQLIGILITLGGLLVVCFDHHQQDEADYRNN